MPVEGMACSGCAYSVETGLRALPGVGAVKAVVAGQRVIVTCLPRFVDSSARQIADILPTVAAGEAGRDGHETGW